MLRITRVRIHADFPVDERSSRLPSVQTAGKFHNNGLYDTEGALYVRGDINNGVNQFRVT